MKRLIGLLAIGLLVVGTVAAGGSRQRTEETEPTIVIEDNMVVELHYEGTLDDGSVFDSSDGREPLEFIYGMGMLIPGLEREMAGMTIGERRTIRVAADDAYGPRLDEALQEIPKDQFPAELELEAGMQLVAQTMQGPIPVTVAEIRENSVMIDFNHPLAGQDLTFDVEIVSIRKATEEELAPFAEMMPMSQ